jgi:hypothetical protein
MFGWRGGVEMGRRLSIDNHHLHHHLHFARSCEVLSQNRLRAIDVGRQRIAGYYDQPPATAGGSDSLFYLKIFHTSARFSCRL